MANIEMNVLKVGNSEFEIADAKARQDCSDLKDDFSHLNYSIKSFEIASGASHSYNVDVCDFDAKSGDVIFITLTSASAESLSCQIFARKTDSTYAKIQNATTDGNKIIVTLAYGITGIGLYFGAQSSNQVITIRVEDTESFLLIPDKLDEVEATAIYGVREFDPLLFKVGTLYSGIYNQYTNNRIAVYQSFLIFDYAITISVDSGWRFGVHTFSSADTSTFIADSGWQTSKYTIPSNTYFRLVIAKVTEVSETAVVNIWLSHVRFDSEIAERITKLEDAVYADGPYYYRGVPVDFKKHGFDVSRIGTVMSIPSGTTNPQGFDIYNNVIFQLYSDNKIKLANYPSLSTIATLDITSGHGDTISFSNEFYDSNDEFPLAYITADTNPATVYIVRITRSATTLVRTLYFGDITKTGYYAGHCLDVNANVLYMVGYYLNSYNDSTGNKMIVSSWNLDSLTDNGDNTYTPEIISSFNVPFMNTVQGQKFYEDKLWLLSSPFSQFDTVIYVVDPYKQKIVTTMDDFPTALKDTECEDIAFVLSDGWYHIVISCYYYYRLDFN